MEAGGIGGGGATLSEIYQSTRRLLLRARDGLERLERLESSSSSYASSSSPSVADSAELSLAVKRDITQIRSLCAEMDRLWRSIPVRGQRDLWKRKVEQVAEEVDSLSESLDKHSFRQQKRMQEAKERAELLERANGESAHILRIFDEEAQAMQSARNSSMMLEEAYATGVAVLSKYAEQRDRLKRAQRKALDILNTVGLSNTVLKLIERRHRVDKWIAYTGHFVESIMPTVTDTESNDGTRVGLLEEPDLFSTGEIRSESFFHLGSESMKTSTGNMENSDLQKLQRDETGKEVWDEESKALDSGIWLCFLLAIRSECFLRLVSV
ncbi:hypothetical protein OPV22_003374 [Ensete ventricosum]|uniref:Membrin n=1 Tax=Ensete ventricosum TaxID=4639 RepID=A0AAV8S0F4_ENSVE|nr:hypothetical protein OPV22_003374 [Ensete ventricosum]